MANDQYPLGYAQACAVFEHALSAHMTIRSAAIDLGHNPNDTVDAVQRVRVHYLDGSLSQASYEHFMALRNQAGVPPVSRPKSQPKTTEPKATEPKATEPKATEPKSSEPDTFAGNGAYASSSSEWVYNADSLWDCKGWSEQPSSEDKGRSEQAASEDKADEDANFEEDRNYTEQERDSSGMINAYRFRILRRDQEPLEGVFSRSEMERIYSLYSYVTVNQLTADFPAYNAAEMRRILRAFNITKDRKIPPHIVEESNPDEAAAFALNAKERVAYKKMDLNRAGFVEKQLRKTQEQVDDLQRERSQVGELVERILDRYCESGRMRAMAPVPAYRPKFGEEVDGRQPGILFFGDTHFGKLFKTEDMSGYGRGTNALILAERMLCAGQELVAQMKRLETSSAHIFNLGDVFESLLPDGMHFQHAAQMELTGELQMLAALEASEAMLRYVLTHGVGPNGEPVRLVYHGMGGNHDRLGKTRDEDKRRTGALIFYTMLEKLISVLFPGQVQVLTYPKGVLSVVVGRLNVIAFHGDSPLSKVKTPELLNAFRQGDSRLYTVVASAHFHSNFTDEGHNYVKMVIGPLCSADDYSQNELAKGSQPSVILVEPAPGYGADLSKRTLY